MTNAVETPKSDVPVRGTETPKDVVGNMKVYHLSHFILLSSGRNSSNPQQRLHETHPYYNMHCLGQYELPVWRQNSHYRDHVKLDQCQ